MRRVVTKLIVTIAITAIGIFAADNSLGTWKRNIEKTKYKPAPTNPITSMTMVREASDGGVKVTATGERKDGSPINYSYTVKYDGTESPVTGSGSAFDSIAVKQIDANTFTSEIKKSGGKYHATGRVVISKDGKTMTLTNKGTDADGKPMSATIVSDKQ